MWRLLLLLLITTATCFELKADQRYTGYDCQYGYPNLYITTSGKCTSIITAHDSRFSYTYNCTDTTYCNFIYYDMVGCSSCIDIQYTIKCKKDSLIYVETTINGYNTNNCSWWSINIDKVVVYIFYGLGGLIIITLIIFIVTSYYIRKSRKRRIDELSELEELDESSELITNTVEIEQNV